MSYEFVPTKDGYRLVVDVPQLRCEIHISKSGRVVREDITIKLPPKAKPSCTHIGNPTGDAIPCKTCKGTVKIKLFACTIHGRCSTSKRLDGVQCCHGCGDYKTR